MANLRLATISFLVCSLAASAAWANGRYPSAQLLLVHPGDPNRLWVRTTYGLLTSPDRGCTWYRMCDGALGYGATEDPMLGVLADGTLIGATFRGLTTSRDQGCNFSLEGPMQEQFVIDLAVQPSDPARALAMVSSGRADGTFTNQVWKTIDSAVSWRKLGQDLDPELLLLTLDAAPSAPSRIYMTATRGMAADGGTLTYQGVLLRSEDDGETWTVRTIPAATGGFDPWLSGIHPADPDKLYVRLRGRDTPNDLVENRVAYSSDGGETWEQIFEARADILGFALSPDGARLLLGLGDSRALNQTRPVDPEALGIYTASTADHRFSRTYAGQIGCLTWSSDGLYFCAAQYAVVGSRGFELGLSTDEGASSIKVMKQAGIEGMLQCPPGSSIERECDDDEWLQICKDFGRCDFETGDLLPYPRGDTCPAGSGGSTGSGATSGTGGALDAGAGANLASDATVRGGCGSCATAAKPTLHPAVSLLSLVSLAGAWFRRRRHR